MVSMHKSPSELELAVAQLKKQNKKLAEELASAQALFDETTIQLARKNRQEARNTLSVAPSEETKQRMLSNALTKLEQYKKDAVFYKQQLANHEHDQTFISELKENSQRQQRVADLEKEVAQRRGILKKFEALPDTESDDPEVIAKAELKEKKLGGYKKFIKELEDSHKAALLKHKATEDWMKSLQVKLGKLTEELNSLPNVSSYKVVLKSRRVAALGLKSAEKVKHFAVSKLKSREAELLKECQRIHKHELNLKQELRIKGNDLEVCKQTLRSMRRPNKSRSMYTNYKQVTSFRSDLLPTSSMSYDEPFLAPEKEVDYEVLSKSVLG
mmetsp:Transcript_7678/g.14496  ORF Transcript_7678/g.14496 Transcript_7678/m.14496 type:complete len:328 (-) Transcript_7678:8338-9321(-)